MEEQWGRLFADLRALPTGIDPETSEQALQILDLAHRHGISAYDAADMGLALRMQLPLATLDRSLAAACRLPAWWSWLADAHLESKEA